VFFKVTILDAGLRRHDESNTQIYGGKPEAQRPL